MFHPISKYSLFLKINRPRYRCYRTTAARIAFLAALVLSLAGSSALAATDDISAPIDQILSSVQTALNDTQRTLFDAKMPPLKNVSVELQAVMSEDAEAVFNLYVVSASGKISSETTQKIFLSLAPPNPEQIAPSGSPKVLAQSLRDSIVQAARGVQAAASRKPPLQVKELKAEFEFVVRKEGSAEAGWKFSLIPIDLKAAGSLSSGVIQTISVDFGY